MRNIPVDVGRMKLTLISVTPKTNMDTKSQRVNNDGEVLWTVQVMSQSNVVDEEGADDRAELTDLTVPGAKPDINPLTEITAENLTARSWAMGDRSGVSFSATRIGPVVVKASRGPVANPAT